jgi:hypothetical protein
LLLGEGLPALFTLGMLALNPLIVDHLSAARGYGLGLGLLLWGLYELMRWTGKPANPVLRRASLAFGLSVSANLAYVLPAAGLGAAFLVMAGREGKLRAALLHFALPAMAIAAVIAGPPLRTATSHTFYVGADTWFESFQRMFRDSFYNAVEAWLSIGFFPGLVSFAARVAMPAIILAAVAAAIAAGRRWRRDRSGNGLDPRGRFLYLAGGAMGVMLAGNTLLHWIARVPYPEPRSGLYWVVLMTLAAAVLVAGLPRRVLRWPAYAVLGLCAAQFALQWNVRDYREWRFDRRTKQIVRLIEEREAGRGRHVRVGATWLLSPSLNFYRTTRRLDWMEPVTRDGPNGPYDYYVLWGDDRPLVDKLALTPLLEDEIAAVVVAVRKIGPSAFDPDHPMTRSPDPLSHPSTSCAARPPAATAWTTVAAPSIKSPAAKTPARLVAKLPLSRRSISPCRVKRTPVSAAWSSGSTCCPMASTTRSAAMTCSLPIMGSGRRRPSEPGAPNRVRTTSRPVSRPPASTW